MTTVKKKYLGFCTVLAILITFSSLSAMAKQSTPVKENASSISDTYKALNLFGDVFEQTRANYVEPVKDKKLIEYALNGMLSNLDPHSGFMNEKEAKSMSIQNKGEFGGLGIEVTMENGVVKVVSPIDDTPAARAGIQSGDLIVEIDGKQVIGMTLSEAVEKMRGKVGAEILLTIVRKGDRAPIKYKIVRAIIQIRSVKSRVENGNIGYIRITTFNAQTAPGLRKAFKDIKKEAGDKLAGYVLDLRNNPGGLLDQGIIVSDAFLDKGEIVSTRGRNPDDTRRDKATPGDKANGLPIVTLINGGSASASEIVAGALQDHKRAIIMGTQSFGKGSVQTLFNVPGGGMIRLTTARYYTPSGRSIQGKGITPDITVERAKVVEEKGMFSEIHESDLKGALKNTDSNKDETPSPKDKKKKDTIKPDSKSDTPNDKDADNDAKNNKIKNDYQLLRAVDLLQGISIYKRGSPPSPETETESSPPVNQ
ncbi:MAG: S41 family peptidase [Alphaproteobacteria bacterium]|nr:S41 family peptidase [Alphaproteobacteria bacterium]